MNVVRQRFEGFSAAFESAFEWLRATQRNEVFELPGVPGWTLEPWRGVEDPEAWYNAVAIRFLATYKQLLREVSGTRLLAEFSARTGRPKHVWDELLEYEGFKHQLERTFFEKVPPRLDGGKLEKASIILFGPPGTAKTSVAKAIAWKLQWPLIELGSDHFAEEGMDGIIRRAQGIFRRLMVLRQCVIFFDEIDELVREREQETEKIGRFITNSVLPWLQQLRDRAEVVFVVATNHIKSFDPAVKRPGRFDYRLPVGPPDKEGRSRMLRCFLKLEGFQETLLDSLCDWIGDGLTWHVTLGELKIISEHVALEYKNKGKPADLDKRITRILERAARSLLITEDDWVEFEQESEQYRFPPRLED